MCDEVCFLIVLQGFKSNDYDVNYLNCNFRRLHFAVFLGQGKKIDGDVQNRVCILGISSVLNRESKSCHLSSELAPPAGYTHHSLTFNSMFFGIW